jgi:putative membrane protein
MIADYLSGFPAFLAHFILASGFVVVFVAIYTWMTPHDEIALMRAGNLPCAIAFTGSIIGFSLPLASAIEHSVSILDNAIWAAISLVIQLAVYYVVTLIFRDLSRRISDGELPAGIWLAGISITAGQLAAASMTT